MGPIIAMTITLAAVYAPIGIQGGLTGALFREFAFTLAGAVVVSGIVALTLSPMMGSKLLREGDTERGFAGFVNRQFEHVRNLYSRLLGGTLQYRPVVLTLWAIVVAVLAMAKSWRLRMDHRVIEAAERFRAKSACARSRAFARA